MKFDFINFVIIQNGFCYVFFSINLQDNIFIYVFFDKERFTFWF